MQKKTIFHDEIVHASKKHSTKGSKQFRLCIPSTVRWPLQQVSGHRLIIFKIPKMTGSSYSSKTRLTFIISNVMTIKINNQNVNNSHSPPSSHKYKNFNKKTSYSHVGDKLFK